MYLFDAQFDYGKLLCDIQRHFQHNQVDERLQKTAMSDFVYAVETHIYSASEYRFNYLLQKRFHDSAIVLSSMQCPHQYSDVGFERECATCLDR